VLTTTKDQAKATPEPRRATSLWRNRDFLLLWSAQIVSSLGTQASQLAFPLLMLAITGSPAQAGLLGALRALPFAILSLPVGALVDRWDRKRVMVLSDLGRAAAMGSIPLAALFGQLTLPHLALVAALEGTLYTFFNLAEAACLPRVVPKEQLPDAIAQTQAAESVSGLVGPALGGLLFGLGSAVPFLVDGVSYLASSIALRFVGAEFQAERPVAADGARPQLWREIREGLVWLWRQPLMRFIALLTGGINLFGFGYSLILIVFAQRLGASAATIGLIFASSGAGSVLGALASGPLQRRYSFRQIVVGTNWVLALTWPLYIVAPNALALGVVNAIIFVAVPVYMGAQYSYRLALIPDALQGRVNSAFRLISYGVQPLSLALTGALLEGIGPAATVWVLFVPQVALAIIAMLNGSLRRAGRFAEAAADGP
jgi:predicted MFS family arabinose efflux permease